MNLNSSDGTYTVNSNWQLPESSVKPVPGPSGTWSWYEDEHGHGYKYVPAGPVHVPYVSMPFDTVVPTDILTDPWRPQLDWPEPPQVVPETPVEDDWMQFVRQHSEERARRMAQDMLERIVATSPAVEPEQPPAETQPETATDVVKSALNDLPDDLPPRKLIRRRAA